jgi:LCP family protein required for cell wall assembly
MKNNKPSIDGFIPRRPGSQLGDLHTMKNPDKAVEPIDRSLHTGDNVTSSIVGVPRTDKLLGRDDIDESLREIDDTEPVKGKKDRKSRRERKMNRVKRPKSKARRIIKWTLIVLLTIGVLVGGYLAVKTFLASNSIFQGSIFDIVRNEPLKEDENGRSNFVIFGTAEDDEGGTHAGATLTDSIMVLSLDQDNKDVYMMSIPRDLWVEYGDICSVGFQGKINAAYFCGSNEGKDEAAGAKAMQAQAEKITGLDIQYYVHLNFTAVVKAVDAVGGVDVKIETPDPRGILDRNFDWKCNYTCYYVNYKQGEVAHLDGEKALALARARNAQGGYGLPGGNFDREKNQQKIVKALREKALSAGTLTNLGAVTGLIDALGQNLRTNIETKEIRTLMDIGQNTNNDNIISLSLVEEGNQLVTTGMYNGQSIVRPVAGLLQYSAIKEYIHENVTAEPFVREEPHVSVMNGSQTAGVAQIEADKLEDMGFVIDVVGNAPEGTYGRIEIYQVGKDKPKTAAKLQELYGVTVQTTAPPMSVVGDTDFLIIVGSAQ